MARATPGDAAFVVILSRSRRVLLVQKADGTWGLPGGRVEKGESARRAVRRELLEETGLRVKEPRLVASGRRAGRTEFLFAITKDRARGNLSGPNGEIRRQKWMRPSRARRLLTNGNALRLEKALPFALKISR